MNWKVMLMDAEAGDCTQCNDGNAATVFLVPEDSPLFNLETKDIKEGMQIDGLAICQNCFNELCSKDQLGDPQ